jgi:hypothetical protein
MVERKGASMVTEGTEAKLLYVLVRDRPPFATLVEAKAAVSILTIPEVQETVMVGMPAVLGHVSANYQPLAWRAYASLMEA